VRDKTSIECAINGHVFELVILLRTDPNSIEVGDQPYPSVTPWFFAPDEKLYGVRVRGYYEMTVFRECVDCELVDPARVSFEYKGHRPPLKEGVVHWIDHNKNASKNVGDIARWDDVSDRSPRT